MRVLVTGANGFIGRAFCKQAASRGHEVLGMVRGASEHEHLDVPTVVGTLDQAPWTAIREFAPDAVLHLAWTAAPGAYLNSPENEVLLEQSKAFLRGCLDAGIPHLAAAGSCGEYAPSADLLSESHSALAGGFPYSEAKLALCRWLEAEARWPRTWTWLRIFYPYGPGEHPRRLPSLLMRQLSAGQTVGLRTPDSVKDYVFIDDLAVAMWVCLESGLTGPVNLGSGQGVRIRDLARRIACVIGANVSLVENADPSQIDPRPTQVADMDRLVAVGWRPKTQLEDGLRSLAMSLGLLSTLESEAARGG